MNAPALLAEFARRGVRVRVVGERLRLAPAEALDDALLAETKRLKAELMRLLATPAVTTPAECGWCASALAPYLLGLAGSSALLCPDCKRWTLAGGGA